MNYRSDIDGLRAIAVTAVVFNHLFGVVVSNGYFGVDVFFVISGFVVSASLTGRKKSSFPSMLVGFYARRMKRLLPALLICVIISSIAFSMINLNPGSHLKSGLAAVFGISNLVFYEAASNYFSVSAALNPFTHTWSLGVEEQFYLIFPLIYWLLLRRQDQERTAITVLVLIALASFVAWLWMLQVDSIGAFYIVVFRFWQLTAGVLAFLFLQSFQRQCTYQNIKNKSFTSTAALAGLLLLLFLPIQGGSALIAIAIILLAVALLLLGGAQSSSDIVLSFAPLILIGRMSYSIYLWHWPVIVIGRWTIGDGPGALAISALIIGILSWVSYRYVELPLRHASWGTNPWQTVAIGIGSMVAAASIVVALAVPLEGRFYVGREPELIARGTETLSREFLVEQGLVWAGEPCALTSAKEVGFNIRRADCTLGDPHTAAASVLVIGNSFSAAFVAAFAEMAKERRAAVTVTSSWGTAIVPEVASMDGYAEVSEYYWTDVVPSLLSEFGNGDLVLLVSDMAYLSPAEPTSETILAQFHLETGLRHLSNILAEQGMRLAILGPLPFTREARCEPSAAIPQWFARDGGPCIFYSRDATLSRIEAVRSTLLSLESEGVLQVVDLFDLFCPFDTCTYLAADGTILYRDAWSHPSVEAARLAAPAFVSLLDAPGPP